MADGDNSVQRLSFLPIMFGILGSTENDRSERVVLFNPFSGNMVVLNGDVGVLSSVLVGENGGSGDGGPAPASKASIDGLKVVTKEESCDESECVVCLEGLFHEGLVVKEMPCQHEFHGECIEKWLKIHGSCPVCRFRMPEEEKKEEKKTEREEQEGQGRNGIWVSFSVGGRIGDDSQQQQRSD